MPLFPKPKCTNLSHAEYNDGYVYVDKTEIIHKMISTGSVYLLSRPRRFGKSLTVSTLKKIFNPYRIYQTGVGLLFPGLYKRCRG
ncbi:MAG: AAA family ATPase [Bacteroidetes bacterium]|nr:AAA family ATPase [Bacteroidota bacterium]